MICYMYRLDGITSRDVAMSSSTVFVQSHTAQFIWWVSLLNGCNTVNPHYVCYQVMSFDIYMMLQRICCL